MFRLSMNFSILYVCLMLYGCGINAESKEEMDEQLKKVARENGIDPDNPKPGTILLSPPKLSAEEEGSLFMPKAYRCEGCTAVAYLLSNGFEAAEKKTKKGASLSEAEILTVTDDICDSDFKGYGLKNVQGTNYLSGEGLEANSMSGMVESGGKWAKRFQNMCKEIMGEYEEETVYSFYQNKDISLKSFICSDYCNFDGVRPVRDDL